MAYSNTKFQLTHLLQAAWKTMGQSQMWKVTGGSATTVINTAWAGIEEAVYEDNDDALINGTVVVAEDAGGAGADPEGRFGRITAYDAASSTITCDSLTGSVAVNDKVAIASPLLPLQDMIELANQALLSLGDFDLFDTSLSFAANQTEYTMPSVIRQKPLRVQVQTLDTANNNQWRNVNSWDVRPATAGQNWTLVLPQSTVGRLIAIKYRILHPKLTAYDSDILEVIHPELAKASLVAHAYQYINNKLGGSNEYLVSRENAAWQELEIARAKFPVEKEVGQVRGLPHWGKAKRYMPLTSDELEWR